MLQPKSFLYEVREGVAWVRLNRPERLNALTFEVYRELTDAFAALEHEREVRAVVVTGEGRAFCSGGDVRDIIGALQGRDAEGLLEFTRLTCELVRNIRRLRKPVIASLNGTTAGAGACIALAADLRVASTEARIAFLFVKVGLSGADMGAAHLLPRLVGLSKATELLYTGDFITAEEALACGLYNRVVRPEQLEAETRTLSRAPRARAFVRARGDEGDAQPRDGHLVRHGARTGGAGAGRLHAAPRLCGSLPRLQREARAPLRRRARRRRMSRRRFSAALLGLALAGASALSPCFARRGAAQEARPAPTPEPAKVFQEARPVNTNATPDPEAFEFELRGFDYHVRHNGNGRRTKGKKTRGFNLRLDRGESVSKLFYSEFEGDLLLILHTTVAERRPGLRHEA